MNLYEISNTYLATAQQLAELDIDEQTLTDTLESEAWPVEEKARAVSAMILNIQAEADMVKATANRLSDRAKTLQARANWLHDYLKTNMQRTGITEIKALDGSFRAKLYIARDASVHIFDPEALPEAYTRIIPAVVAPDKASIKKALNDGIAVPGACLEFADRLEIK